ncbi:MAG: hypothetical protein M3Y30_07915 [Gemmatimonadota bacterium]|nr:hypothetical protein [Gemmatimonadota bacterium]
MAMALILASLGCHAAEKAPPDTSTSAASVHADSVAPSLPTATNSPASAPPPAPAHPIVKSEWAVTDSGAGMLRIGMTRDQLALDMHSAVPKHTRADSGCAYLAVPGIPAGMRTMWVAATLARIDIGAPKLPTDRGVSVGDKAAKVEQLYQGSVTALPAKYDPRGKYLVVKVGSGTDTTRRIVFETDSTTRITRFRVGREPEVEWVEGCS